LSKKSQGKKQERLDQLNYFGKTLVRRCSSQCELCEDSGVSLHIYEVAPIPKEPEIDHCLMICDACEQNLSSAKHMQVDHWRCLSKTMWSEVAAAKVLAIALLKHLAEKNAWAQEGLEMAYLDEDEQQWVDDCLLFQK